MTTITRQPMHGWTEQQLESLPHVGKVELIDGKIIMSPASFDHGVVASIILARLLSFALEHHLGLVVDSSTGFRMNNEDLLSPDVSFVAAARFRGLPQPLRRFFRGSPDLAVEVLSPNDSPQEVDRKIETYMANDTRLVWVVDATRKVLTVRRPGTPAETLNESDSLSGAEVLPGFSMKVADIFRPYP